MPTSVRDHGLTDRYLTTGIAAVGLVVAAAAVRGSGLSRTRFPPNAGCA